MELTPGIYRIKQARQLKVDVGQRHGARRTSYIMPVSVQRPLIEVSEIGYETLAKETGRQRSRGADKYKG